MVGHKTHRQCSLTEHSHKKMKNPIHFLLVVVGGLMTSVLKPCLHPCLYVKVSKQLVDNRRATVHTDT